jgi:RNA polymerase sigma-70 factor (ECF subfamily)
VALVRACHRILGDRSDAEDAAQEALVTAYRQLASWRGDGPFGAWLMRIGIRIALRQAGKRRTVTWRDPLGGGTPGGGGGGSSFDPIAQAVDQAAIESAPLTDPAMLSMRAERATELRAAVTALPEPYREVVALRFFGDATLDEIARVTERPLGTVKTHLHRGLARLRTNLERDDR